MRRVGWDGGGNEALRGLKDGIWELHCGVCICATFSMKRSMEFKGYCRYLSYVAVALALSINHRPRHVLLETYPLSKHSSRCR